VPLRDCPGRSRLDITCFYESPTLESGVCLLRARNVVDMIQDGEVVYLVDDDASIRDGLSEQLMSEGRRVVSFSSAGEFLDYIRTDTAACLILDVGLPDLNGLELQERLCSSSAPSIIFISGYSDIPTSVQAMKAGAIEFLVKPVEPGALSSAIDLGFAQDRRRRKRLAELSVLRKRYDLLTPREREVLPLIVAGLLNKQAAAELGISEVTLQVHRGQIMRKMEAPSFAELVRMCGRLSIRLPDVHHSHQLQK
jgi:FixJ family two-component response regulator